MGATKDKLQRALDNKRSIRSAISEVTGSDPGNNMSNYPSIIRDLRDNIQLPEDIERVSISLISNQPGIDEGLFGTEIRVTYEGFDETYTWQGVTITLEIPTGLEYTVTAGEAEGYKSPESLEYTNTAESNKITPIIIGPYLTEIVTVNVSADNGTPTGFEVTISKQELVGVATKYMKLEYIEATGTQWIDTGFTPNQDTSIYMDATPTVVSASNPSGFFFGSSNPSSLGGIELYAYDNIIICNRGSESVLGNIRVSGGDRFSISLEKNICTVVKGSDIVYSNTFFANETFVSPVTLRLFYLPRNSPLYGVVKLYSCKIYDNGILVRDYIPALRSDGIAGLYDAVNDTFTASSGSGNFSYNLDYQEVIATQTSVTGNYKIPFDTSYAIQTSKISGYNAPAIVIRIASEKSYTVSQQYIVIKARDLSLMDVYGNPINQSTANCYVVREAGTYKFPLVFGNSIKNGKVNTAAFTNNGGTCSHDFVLATGGVFNENNYKPALGLYGIPSIEVSNSDIETNSVISSISIENNGLSNISYCKFVVESIPVNGGNVILTLREFMGEVTTVLWSWHIWLWPHDLSPVEITNSTGVKYNIMPVNLASKYDDDLVHIKNWFYQWGRPNPILLPSAWNSTTDHPNGSISKESKADELWRGLANPSTFYLMSGKPWNWFGDKSYYNLWDASCTGTGNSDNDTVKTVYDPCPVGWKIPNGNTFTGLSIIGGANGIVKLRRYSDDTEGVEFPLSGMREPSLGGISHTNLAVHVWLSSTTESSQDNASQLYVILEDNYISPNSGYSRAYGHSVRPVEDDLTKIDTI